MKLPPSLILLFFSIIGNSQTTIICVKGNDAVYVAVDSRMVHKNFTLHPAGNVVANYTFSKMCKILTVNQYNFACAGRFIQDVFSQAKIEARKSKSSMGLVNSLFNSFKKRLNDTIQERVKTSYTVLKESLKGITNLVQIVIFGHEADTVFRYLIRYQILLNDVTQSADIGGYIKLDRELPLGFAIGSNSAIAVEVESKKTWAGSIVNELNRFMDIQIKVDSFSVGKPVHIRCSTPYGSHWSQQEAPCKY